MRRKYKTLKELKNKIEADKLQIILDNDQVCYYYSDGADEDPIEITVESAGNGYEDYMELYALCFPGASIEYC